MPRSEFPAGAEPAQQPPTELLRCKAHLIQLDKPHPPFRQRSRWILCVILGFWFFYALVRDWRMPPWYWESATYVAVGLFLIGELGEWMTRPWIPVELRLYPDRVRFSGNDLFLRELAGIGRSGRRIRLRTSDGRQLVFRCQMLRAEDFFDQLRGALREAAHEVTIYERRAV